MLADGIFERNQGLITLIALVVGTFLTIIVYGLQRARKRLDHAIMSDSAILAAVGAVEGIEVTWRGDQVLKFPRLVTLRLQNTGNRVIRLDDFDGPVVIELTHGVIVAADVIDKRESVRHPGALEIVPAEYRTVSVHPTLLNEGDWIEIQLLIDQDTAEWAQKSLQVHVVIEGQTRPGKRFAPTEIVELSKSFAEAMLPRFTKLAKILARQRS